MEEITDEDMFERLRDIPSLDHGSHSTRDEGMCLMEAVAFVAGEPHSDHPACSCPILASIGRALNDRWNDEERQLLAPLIPRLVGTRSTPEVARRRAYAMADAGIREIAPMGLEAVGWRDLAERTRAIGPVVDRASGYAALQACSSIRDEARTRSKAAASADAADYNAAAAAAADAYNAAAYAAAYAADAYNADAYNAAAYNAAAYAAVAAAAAAAADAYNAAADAYNAADAASAAADAASAAAADAAADAAAANKLSSEKYDRIRRDARRPIIEATLKAFERAIEIR